MDSVSGIDLGEQTGGETRTTFSYVEEIYSLQERLHTAHSDLEQSNSDCVKLIQEMKDLKAEADEAKAKVRKLSAENSALKRKLESIEGGEEMPRPGPRLKPFEDLTPKHQKRASDKLQAEVKRTSEERSILPTKLSAFLTYRFGSFSFIPVLITFG